MPNSWLLEKNFNGGLQETHYFDGRLLSADAFKADQDAVQTRLDWLGRATGYGIIDGLIIRKVRTSETQLSISRGLGLSYSGRVIRLPGDMTLSLTKSAPAPVSTAASAQQKTGTFTSVSLVQQQQATTNGNAVAASTSGIIPEGVYLLTVLPVSQFEGLALMRSSVSGVASGVSNAPGCGSKWEVEGVQFKVIRLDTSDLSGLFANVPDIPRDEQGILRQNLLAHWCYGTLIVRDFGIHPFDFPDKYSPLDPNAVFIPDLSADDLPLAAFHWDGSRITFVDSWIARRRVVHPDAVTGTNSSLQVGSWKAIMDDRRVAENQARFRQFQDQLDSIVAAGNKPGSGTDLTRVKVTDSFTFLPPVGLLPVTQDCLQTILCHIDEKPRIIGRERETEQWDANVHLIVSAPELRAIGEFAGGVAGTLLNTVVPQLGIANALASTNGILSRIIGGIGNLFHRSATRTVEGQPDPGQVGEGAAGGEPAPTPPPQEFGGGIQLGGHSEKERVVYEMPHVRFHQRVCVTISQPRVKADGTARSKTEGFDLGRFFDGYLLRFSLIGKDRVDQLMNTSWYEDAIDLRPDRHPDPPVKYPGEEPKEYPIEKGLYPMPLVFDIYLVEENLRDLKQPLYILFHKALHPAEIIRYYRHRAGGTGDILPQDGTPTEEVLPPSQASTEEILPPDEQS
ncbi:MAG: hypothetical protein ACJ797_20085 [Ktedonobacteraceae bacterium]